MNFSSFNAVLRWVIPIRDHLCVVPRIIMGAVGNAVLAFYLWPRATKMSDITLYPHLTANPPWFCAELGTPLVILLCLAPLYFSKRFIDRLTALALSLYPIYFFSQKD